MHSLLSLVGSYYFTESYPNSCYTSRVKRYGSSGGSIMTFFSLIRFLTREEKIFREWAFYFILFYFLVQRVSHAIQMNI